MSAAADFSLRHPTGTSELFVGRGASERAQARIDSWISGRHVFLISSEPVARLYLEPWRARLAACEALTVLVVPDGEAAKTVEVATDLWDRMAANGGRRDARVVGLGGGTVGDLAGFVAASFLRGVDWMPVPTTLLAQIDASIGGKTGLDLERAKNSVGAFHHPTLVVADTETLGTLPSRELRSGLVEAIKIGAASELPLFDRLERDMDDLLGDPTTLAMDEAVRTAAAAKIRIVESDPEEADRRRVLNLGHTLGHAIETVLGYRSLRHGEAVTYGLRFVLRLAAARGGHLAWLRRVERLLLRLTPPPLPDLDAGELLAAVSRDKKRTAQGVAWILPMAPGRVEIASDLSADALRSALEGFLADPAAQL